MPSSKPTGPLAGHICGGCRERNTPMVVTTMKPKDLNELKPPAQLASEAPAVATAKRRGTLKLMRQQAQRQVAASRKGGAGVKGVVDAAVAAGLNPAGLVAAAEKVVDDLAEVSARALADLGGVELVVEAGNERSRKAIAALKAGASQSEVNELLPSLPPAPRLAVTH